MQRPVDVRCESVEKSSLHWAEEGFPEARIEHVEEWDPQLVEKPDGVACRFRRGWEEFRRCAASAEFRKPRVILR